MKKNILFLSGCIVALTIALNACKKDEGTGGGGNQTPGPCDGKNYTYTNTVKAIVDANCIACHSASGSASSIPLVNYDQVKAATASGMLINSIKHIAGYRTMPEGLPKLADSTIQKIECWKNAGMAN